MSDAHGPYPLNVWAKVVRPIILLRRVLLRLRWGRRYTKDIRPLLQGLVVVLRR
jgi:hypothetical protein